MFRVPHKSMNSRSDNEETCWENLKDIVTRLPYTNTVFARSTTTRTCNFFENCSILPFPPSTLSTHSSPSTFSTLSPFSTLLTLYIHPLNRRGLILKPVFQVPGELILSNLMIYVNYYLWT